MRNLSYSLKIDAAVTIIKNFFSKRSEIRSPIYLNVVRIELNGISRYLMSTRILLEKVQYRNYKEYAPRLKLANWNRLDHKISTEKSESSFEQSYVAVPGKRDSNSFPTC